MNQEVNQQFIESTIKDKALVPILNAGAGRGAKGNLEYLANFNKKSSAHALLPEYVDPVPGRANDVADKASSLGLAAIATEGTIQQVLAKSESLFVVGNLDKPGTLADLVERTSERTTLAYFLTRMPNEELWGFASVLSPGDDRARDGFVFFLNELKGVTARTGSRHVLGDKGPVKNRIVEPQYRQWFGNHLNRNLAKVLAGLEPESYQMEATRDGRTSMPVVFYGANEWSDPKTLAESLVNNPPFPMIRGEDVAVAEMTRRGIRIHRVRRRLTDGKVAVRAAALLDPESIEEARRKAERAEISKARPSFFTD